MTYFYLFSRPTDPTVAVQHIPWQVTQERAGGGDVIRENSPVATFEVCKHVVLMVELIQMTWLGNVTARSPGHSGAAVE